jgi:thiosulfate reductase cytochrome b subunit
MVSSNVERWPSDVERWSSVSIFSLLNRPNSKLERHFVNEKAFFLIRKIGFKEMNCEVVFRLSRDLLFLHFLTYYSLLKLSTGLTIAAFTAWKLTVNKVISSAPIPVAAKIHHDIAVRYS